jgi:hypothetical protein
MTEQNTQNPEVVVVTGRRETIDRPSIEPFNNNPAYNQTTAGPNAIGVTIAGVGAVNGDPRSAGRLINEAIVNGEVAGRNVSRLTEFYIKDSPIMQNVTISGVTTQVTPAGPLSSIFNNVTGGSIIIVGAEHQMRQMDVVQISAIERLATKDFSADPVYDRDGNTLFDGRGVAGYSKDVVDLGGKSYTIYTDATARIASDNPNARPYTAIIDDRGRVVELNNIPREHRATMQAHIDRTSIATALELEAYTQHMTAKAADQDIEITPVDIIKIELDIAEREAERGLSPTAADRHRLNAYIDLKEEQTPIEEEPSVEDETTDPNQGYVGVDDAPPNPSPASTPAIPATGPGSTASAFSDTPRPAATAPIP